MKIVINTERGEFSIAVPKEESASAAELEELKEMLQDAVREGKDISLSSDKRIIILPGYIVERSIISIDTQEDDGAPESDLKRALNEIDHMVIEQHKKSLLVSR